MEALIIAIVFLGAALINWLFYCRFNKQNPKYILKYLNLLATIVAFLVGVRYLYGFIQWVIWEYL